MTQAMLLWLHSTIAGWVLVVKGWLVWIAGRVVLPLWMCVGGINTHSFCVIGRAAMTKPMLLSPYSNMIQYCMITLLLQYLAHHKLGLTWLAITLSPGAHHVLGDCEGMAMEAWLITHFCLYWVAHANIRKTSATVGMLMIYTSIHMQSSHRGGLTIAWVKCG
jgi:hypothetical protein